MKVKRKIIKIDENKCDGCGLCVPACAEGAIQIVDGKAKLIAEKYCDGLGACLGECPRGALRIIECEVDEFNQTAVDEHMESNEAAQTLEGLAMACRCPSTLIQSFASPRSCKEENKPAALTDSNSALSHWPVQIILVPPIAPFLKEADLLVAADCTTVAYPRFHNDFLKRKVILLGCPKFDETDIYIEKFAQIFREANIRNITVVVMEVPCCQGLPVIVRKGMDIVGKKIPMEKVIISKDGKVLKREFSEE